MEYKSKEELESPPITDTIVTEEPVVEKSFFLRIKVLEKVFAMSDNPNSLVVGERGVAKVSTKINKEILLTDDNGVVLLPILSETNSFHIVAGKNGYLNNTIDFTISQDQIELRPDRFVFDYEILIEKIFEGVEITLDNIYYDFNESIIREDAKPSLNHLVSILKNNPDISIGLASHTDCRGDDDYNLNLSQLRAVAAIKYIHEVGGVSNERLSALGYGASRPEIDCSCDSCSEDEHQVNRRTTFLIKK